MLQPEWLSLRPSLPALQLSLIPSEATITNIMTGIQYCYLSDIPAFGNVDSDNERVPIFFSSLYTERVHKREGLSPPKQAITGPPDPANTPRSGARRGPTSPAPRWVRVRQLGAPERILIIDV